MQFWNLETGPNLTKKVTTHMNANPDGSETLVARVESRVTGTNFRYKKGSVVLGKESGCSFRRICKLCGKNAGPEM